MYNGVFVIKNLNSNNQHYLYVHQIKSYGCAYDKKLYIFF